MADSGDHGKRRSWVQLDPRAKVGQFTDEDDVDDASSPEPSTPSQHKRLSSAVVKRISTAASRLSVRKPDIATATILPEPGNSSSPHWQAKEKPFESLAKIGSETGEYRRPHHTTTSSPAVLTKTAIPAYAQS